MRPIKTSTKAFSPSQCRICHIFSSFKNIGPSLFPFWHLIVPKHLVSMVVVADKLNKLLIFSLKLVLILLELLMFFKERIDKRVQHRI